MAQETTAGDVRLVTSEYEKKYGLPEGTLYKQAGIESNFGNAMLSPKGAQGWFGFMPKTAKEYGVTDPHDLRNSADGAARKMADLLKQHQGNMDYALVDYNGGHRAVKALMAGKPWAESAGYLEKFHGQTMDEILAKRPVQPMGDQFTSQTNVSPTDGPNAGKLGCADRERDRKFGGVTGFASNAFDAVALGFETQNSTWNFFKDNTIKGLGEPLDWQGQEAKDTLGQFPDAHWPYLQQSVTKEELASRSTRLRTIMDKEKELAGMGLPLALTGGIIGGIPSVENLAAMIPFAGQAGMLTKAGRVANAVRLGVAGAASNVAFDAVANQYKPTATPEDLYMSALMGLGFGAIGGASVNPHRIALREENLRIQEIARRRAAEGLRGEVDDWLKGPRPVLPFEFPPREEFLRKLDEWSGGLGRNPPEKPKMAILSHGPEDTAPVPRKGSVDEPSGNPKVGPAEPPDVHPGSPTGKPWGPEWDSPTRVNRLGAPEILMLPPLGKISHLADYVRQFSTNPDIAALMDRALKSLDLRKLKFDVVDPKVDPRTLKVSGKTARHMEGAYGVVVTPYGSNGDGIEMALRGYGWGQRHNGLNEETFVHELLHAATVYKWHRVSTGNTAGLKAETLQAYKELDKLYRTVKAVGTKGVDVPARFATYMQNPREFISYGLTSRTFQTWLKSVEVAGAKSTLWTQFTDSLRKMLGMTKEEGNAYAKLIDLTEGLNRDRGLRSSTQEGM